MSSFRAIAGATEGLARDTGHRLSERLEEAVPQSRANGSLRPSVRPLRAHARISSGNGGGCRIGREGMENGLGSRTAPYLLPTYAPTYPVRLLLTLGKASLNG